ncbi:hypothetical protein DZB84_15030 [Bacillus sp. HNG]|uniref:hypothetical protein n=1 Tax=Bacillus sp. HNG TaxID=2293325 RepID=UPI000E2FDEB7|nr:hypothetical protein [Bacillus sp. HNG]RFB14757.1 hypothetical protein DZB84_15030 [Bacillus sp. HNG]
MEELLKQILTGQDEIRHEIGNMKNEVSEVKTELASVKTEVTAVKKGLGSVKTELKSEISAVKTELKSEILEVKEVVRRIELSRPQDIVALLERMNKNLENKTEVLNKRVFNVEVEIERLKQQ